MFKVVLVFQCVDVNPTSATLCVCRRFGSGILFGPPSTSPQSVRWRVADISYCNPGDMTSARCSRRISSALCWDATHAAAQSVVGSRFDKRRLGNRHGIIAVHVDYYASACTRHWRLSLAFGVFSLLPRRAETIFQQGSGSKIKFYHVTWYADFHPTLEIVLIVNTVCECRHVVSNVLHFDRWSLPVLWHLSDIIATCNFWPQLQILGGQLTPLTRPPQAPALSFHTFRAHSSVSRPL